MRRIPSLALLFLVLAGSAAAQQPPAGRCVRDAMGSWYCAKDPKGTAVIDALGAAVCAPGGCVQFQDEWRCSSVSGGRAELTTDGPLCEGECRAPRAVECSVEPRP